MAKCERCGQETFDGAAFCPNCGAPLKQPEANPFEGGGFYGSPGGMNRDGFSSTNANSNAILFMMRHTSTFTVIILPLYVSFVNLLHVFFTVYGQKSLPRERPGTAPRHPVESFYAISSPTSMHR